RGRQGSSTVRHAETLQPPSAPAQAPRRDDVEAPTAPRRLGELPPPAAVTGIRVSLPDLRLPVVSPTARGRAEGVPGSPGGEWVAEPVVHVTIGRVEIRATQDSPTNGLAAARPSKPSAMSLDEYLHRRGREGSR